MLNDIQNWSNYTSGPSVAELKRLTKIVNDAAKAEELGAFGLRPLGALDKEPHAIPERHLQKPFDILDEHLYATDILVDIRTGFRFRYLSDEGGLVFDLQASADFIDAVELLMLAAKRSKEFIFERVKRRTFISAAAYVTEPEYILPLSLHVSSRAELQDVVDRLTDLFCRQCPKTKKLWFRGQRGEYFLERSADLTQQLYGVGKMTSLLPSAGRHAFEHPEKMGFDLSFSGPNHQWKKPFLIWLMRQNAHWFERDARALDLLSKALDDDDDQTFTEILCAIQCSGLGPTGFTGDVSWPDEADDLRQWFFAFMKPHSFGITLQQYGYVTSLLDLTDDLDVALYFSHAAMSDRKIRKTKPRRGRLIYIFAERSTGDFFRHGKELFWGNESWVRTLPPRLSGQKAGFLMGSTCRTQNLYANMIVARVFLEDDFLESSLPDEVLFPGPTDDLLYATLLSARPPLEGLY